MNDFWDSVPAVAKQPQHKTILKAVTQGLHNPPQFQGGKMAVKASEPPLPEDANDCMLAGGPRR